MRCPGRLPDVDTSGWVGPNRDDRLDAVVARLRHDGITRVLVLAWRDLDDPDAGGSERYVDALATRWAGAGLTVTVRTRRVRGADATTWRHGYTVIRRGGRLTSFVRSIAAQLFRRDGRVDAVVEIWNGVPFLTPLWVGRRPYVVVLHHPHAQSWEVMVAGVGGRIGKLVELRLAPWLYRLWRSPVVTLSASSRQAILAQMPLRPEQVAVVPVGIDPVWFTSGGARSAVPAMVCVARLVPTKGVDALITAAVVIRERLGSCELHIVGDGPEAGALDAQIAALGATAWIRRWGYVEDDTLVALYRQAWFVVSWSAHEGWGMTLTEGGACGTPGVARDIPGHRDAVRHGETGLLVATIPEFVDAVTALCQDAPRRAQLGVEAQRRAATLSWDRTATGVLEAMVSPGGRARPGRRIRRG